VRLQSATEVWIVSSWKLETSSTLQFQCASATSETADSICPYQRPNGSAARDFTARWCFFHSSQCANPARKNRDASHLAMTVSPSVGLN